MKLQPECRSIKFSILNMTGARLHRSFTSRANLSSPSVASSSSTAFNTSFFLTSQYNTRFRKRERLRSNPENNDISNFNTVHSHYCSVDSAIEISQTEIVENIHYPICEKTVEDLSTTVSKILELILQVSITLKIPLELLKYNDVNDENHGKSCICIPGLYSNSINIEKSTLNPTEYTNQTTRAKKRKTNTSINKLYEIFRPKPNNNASYTNNLKISNHSDYYYDKNIMQYDEILVKDFQSNVNIALDALESILINKDIISLAIPKCGLYSYHVSSNNSNINEQSLANMDLIYESILNSMLMVSKCIDIEDETIEKEIGLVNASTSLRSLIINLLKKLLYVHIIICKEVLNQTIPCGYIPYSELQSFNEQNNNNYNINGQQSFSNDTRYQIDLLQYYYDPAPAYNKFSETIVDDKFPPAYHNMDEYEDRYVVRVQTGQDTSSNAVQVLVFDETREIMLGPCGNSLGIRFHAPIDANMHKIKANMKNKSLSITIFKAI